MKNKLLPAFLFCLFLLPLFSFPSDTINLSNSRYYPAVLKAIQNASKSISVCMYYISYTSVKNSKVEQILNAMADAIKRGVKVEVVLDRAFEVSLIESNPARKKRLNATPDGHLKFPTLWPGQNPYLAAELL